MVAPRSHNRSLGAALTLTSLMSGFLLLCDCFLFSFCFCPMPQYVKHDANKNPPHSAPVRGLAWRGIGSNFTPSWTFLRNISMVPVQPVASEGMKSRGKRSDERFMASRQAASSVFYQPLINQIGAPVRSASHSALHSFESASPLSSFQISAHRKITLLHCSHLLPPLSPSLFRPHSFPILLLLLFSLPSIISHLLWFKSSGLSVSACGSSKTNGSSLHLLLITPHPPSPFPFPYLPTATSSSSAPAPFFLFSSFFFSPFSTGKK